MAFSSAGGAQLSAGPLDGGDGVDRVIGRNEDVALIPASAPDWELPGNRPLYILSGRLLGLLDRHPESSFLTEVQLRGDFWSTAETTDAPDIVPDFSVVLHQIELPRARLADASRSLERWLATYDPQDLELSIGQESRFLRFSLQPDVGTAGTIHAAQHPVFRIRFATEALAGEGRFVVDQSCIRRWLDGLRAWLGLAAV